MATVKEVIAGISISDDLAALAVLEHRENEVELLYLDDMTRSGDAAYWYVDILERFSSHSRRKINQVAVALDAGQLTIIQCPIDIALNQSDRNEHIDWELSQYIPRYNPREYINDVHILDTQPHDGIQRVLVVSVLRDTIFGLQETLAQLGVALGVVDVNHLATDSAILRNHPEVEKTTCFSLGFNSSRIDTSLLNNGNTTTYQYNLPKTDEDTAAFLKSVLEQQSVSRVFLHGQRLSKEVEKFVRSITRSSVAILNPFRRIIISLNFPAFTRYLAQVHRFSSAVGIALRRA